MRVSVIIGHPYEGSFNSAIAETAAKALFDNGHEVFFHDLYKERFNPVTVGYELINDSSQDPAVERYCREIRDSDGIVIVHPNWWGQPPAILKGWVDRVLRNGVAYAFAAEDNGSGVPDGLLKAKAGLVFNTSNTHFDREQEVFGDPLETIWKNCIFGFCGVKQFYRKMFCVVADSTLEQRQKWLEEVRDAINRYFPKGETQ